MAFSCNATWALLSEGANVFGNLAVFLLQVTVLNCGRLVSNKLWFYAICYASEHPPLKSEILSGVQCITLK